MPVSRHLHPAVGAHAGSLFAPKRSVWPAGLLLVPFIGVLAGCQSMPAPTVDATPIAPSTEAVTTAAPAANAATVPPNGTTAGADAAQQAQTYYQVLLGQLAAQRGDMTVALNNLLTAAETSRDLTLARQAFSLAQRQRDPGLSLRAATLLAYLDGRNPEALVALALAQWQNDQVDTALNTLNSALALVGSVEDEQLALLGRFARVGGPAAIPVLAELARQHPQPQWVLLAAAVQANHFGDRPYAMALLDRNLDANPDYLRAVLVKAELLAQYDAEAGIALLEEAKPRFPDNRELTLALGRAQYSQGLFPAATATLAPLAANKKDDEARYLHAVSLYMAGDWAGALPRLEASAEQGHQSGAAGWLCGQAAERLQKLKRAMACYYLVKPADSQYLPAVRARARLLVQEDKLDDAMADLAEARLQLDTLQLEPKQRLRMQTSLLAEQLKLLDAADRFADAETLYASEPEAYRRAIEPSLRLAGLDQHAAAAVLERYREQRPAAPETQLEWVLTAVELLQEKGYGAEAYQLLSDELKQQPEAVELLYIRALVGEPLGHHDQTEADLRRVLALNPNHVEGLNALGYTLADHNRQLDEALELIQRAHRARPTSAAILDSLGWVHYRRGELTQARDWLARAYGLEPDPEIVAHYAEVLAKLDEKRLARKLVKQTQARFPDHAALNAVAEQLK